MATVTPSATRLELARKEFITDADNDAHRKDIQERLGMTPEKMVTHLIVYFGGWTVMFTLLLTVINEYMYYYIRDEPTWVVWLLAIRLPPAAACAILVHPMLGALSDRVGRRPILVPTTWIGVASVLFWVFFPSAWGIYVATSLSVISGVLFPMTRSMLRDCYPKKEFETGGGGAGYTAILAKLNATLGVIGLVSVILCVAVVIPAAGGNEYRMKCKPCIGMFSSPSQLALMRGGSKYEDKELYAAWKLKCEGPKVCPDGDADCVVGRNDPATTNFTSWTMGRVDGMPCYNCERTNWLSGTKMSYKKGETCYAQWMIRDPDLQCVNPTAKLNLFAATAAEKAAGLAENPPRAAFPNGKMSFSNTYCRDPDDTGFAMDGGLRLAMIIAFVGCAFSSAYATLFVPETLRPTQKTSSTRQYLAEKWRNVLRPWDNCRPLLATPTSRVIVAGYVFTWLAQSVYVVTGAFLIWKFNMSSVEIGFLALLSAFFGIIGLCFVPALVKKFGDFRLWQYSLFCGQLGQAAALALIPLEKKRLLFLIYIFVSPALTIAVVCPEALIQKIMPSDVQATMQTGREAIFQFTRMWSPVLMAVSFQYVYDNEPAYPGNGLPFFLSFACIAVGFLVLTLNKDKDPRKAIDAGKGLEAFYASDYAKSEWYAAQGSGNYQALQAAGDDATIRRVSHGAISPRPDDP